MISEPVKSLPHKHKGPSSILHTHGKRQGTYLESIAEKAEPWASLTSQPSLCGEFQAEGETLSQKSKWKAPEKRHWRLASGFYKHEHVSTPVLSPTYKIWSEQKSCKSNFQKTLTLWSCCIKSAPCQYPGHWVTFQSLTLKNSMGVKRRLGR